MSTLKVVTGLAIRHLRVAQKTAVRARFRCIAEQASKLLNLLGEDDVVEQPPWGERASDDSLIEQIIHLTGVRVAQGWMTL